MFFHRLSILFLVVTLTACSQLEPFVDARREAGQVEPIGQSRKERVAICYNPLWHSSEELQELAEEACESQKKNAVYETTEYFNCRFVNPNTNFYNCL